MFGSNVLDTAIGMIFFYLFLSLVCSGINEAIAAFLNKRGKNLFEGISNLLNDPKFTGLAQQLYNHGLVDGMSRPGKLPSYLSSRVFSTSLLDIVGSRGVGASIRTYVTQAQTSGSAASFTIDQAKQIEDLMEIAEKAAREVTGMRDTEGLRKAAEALHDALSVGRGFLSRVPDPVGTLAESIEKLPRGNTQEALRLLVTRVKREFGNRTAQEQLQELEAAVEAWFDEAMDRVSGWYKRWTQVILLVISTVLIVATNADSITLANRLAQDSALRAQMVTHAQRATAQPLTPESAQVLVDNARELALPLGWDTDDAIPRNPWALVYKIIGLLISIFAVSLGAPWWFDVLSRVTNLRGAGIPPGQTSRSAQAAGSVKVKVG